MDMNVPIQVFDDLIDEASNQYFIAEFRVAEAVNPSLISLAQRASRCRIVDNDRKLRQLNIYYMSQSGIMVRNFMSECSYKSEKSLYVIKLV